MRKPSQSSFQRLVSYLADNRNTTTRVAEVMVKNCISDDIHLAIPEVLATQKFNTRAKSDKTYHLVLSFPHGEKPSREILEQIEASVCDSLGFKDHQRIAIAHDDTDFFHMHIAINKIHPTKFTLHEPYYDKLQLLDICSNIELKHGLVKDNHEVSRATSNAARIEHASGIESFCGWLKRNCRDDLEESGNWIELHQRLENRGVKIHRKGNGIVFINNDGLAVKASAVDRQFSLRNLESRFGPWVSSPPLQETNLGVRYTKQPVTKNDLLWSSYRQEMEENRQLLSMELGDAKALRDQALKAAAIGKRLGRGIARNNKDKRQRNFLNSKVYEARTQEIYTKYRADSQALRERYRYQNWNDWLKYQAQKGNLEALKYLRDRKPKVLDAANHLASGGQDTPQQIPDSQHVVTKHGTAIVSSSIRDHGDKIVLRQATDDEVKVALELAWKRFGKDLTVHGTDEFRSQVARIASLAGVEAPTFAAAPDVAKEYSQKRNQSAVTIQDILPHRPWCSGDVGPVAFSGIRNVGGIKLALFNQNGTILVKEASDYQARRLSKLQIGQVVELLQNGQVNFKQGRSR